MCPDSPERKLAAILSADVVGYSRLMAEDEAATIRTVTAYREQIGTLVSEHRGRVVDSPGDNLLAEFPTALDAVQAAVEVQRVIGARNADLSPERRMEFRIGVHMGDVTAEGDRLYGDGVNIAARLEGLANPGGICISGEVHGQVERRLDSSFDDLGEQSVKNIPRRVRAYRVRPTGAARKARRSVLPLVALGVMSVVTLLIVGAVLRDLLEERFGDRGIDERFLVPGYGDVPAVAVLPFDNLSADPEQEYFADGITEDLITRLSSSSRLPVIARNSSFTYKGKAVDVQHVGRELGVRYVIEGSVRKAGEQIRISAQLIDATSGHHVWAKTYDRELRDIFAIQDQITEAIVGEVAPELWRAEITRAARADPRNLDAYQLTMRARWELQTWGSRQEDVARARSLLEQALELDPGYAPALAALAATYRYEIHSGWTHSLERALDEYERTARACVEADARFALCWLALASVHQLRGRREDWLATLDRARRLDPPVGLFGVLGVDFAIAGELEQASEMLEKAIRLSPHDPFMWFFFFGKGLVHFVAGRYAEAAEGFQESLRLQPDFNLAWRQLAASCALLGRMDDARAAMQQVLRLEPNVTLARVRVELSASDPDYLERYFDGLRKAGMPEE